MPSRNISATQSYVLGSFWTAMSNLGPQQVQIMQKHLALLKMLDAASFLLSENPMIVGSQFLGVQRGKFGEQALFPRGYLWRDPRR